MAPSETTTVRTTDSAQAEISHIETGLARMENKALTQQRVALTEEKTDKFGKLALGAKLDRALDRRMSGQDAVMKPRKPQRRGAASVDLLEKAHHVRNASSGGGGIGASDSEKENEKKA